MELKEKLANLPKKPGCYIMRDSEGDVIYVGKAKNLKNRVSSYFHGEDRLAPKTAEQMRHVADFEYIVTNSELEALILECNLIKKYMPKYNILLKDGKGYPYIRITLNEEFPRIMLARRVENDGAKYFGPFLSSNIVNETIDLVKKIFMVRDCNRNLPRDIGKERPCLNYSIKKCSAPCAGFISVEEYKANFEKIIKFLNGDYGTVIDGLKAEMERFSTNLEFEKAAAKRDKILAIERISEKQKITSTNLDNKDVIAFAKGKSEVCIQIFYVRDGKMLGRENFFVKDNSSIDRSARSGGRDQRVHSTLVRDDGTLLGDFIKQYYALNTQIPRRIFTQVEAEDRELLEEWLTGLAGVKISINTPQKGVNKDLVRMAEENAREALSVRERGNVFEKKNESLLAEVKEVLGMEKVPHLIESYDISHISGADAVGVCVCFKDGLAYKRGYKTFNIKNHPVGYAATPPREGNYYNDDYGALREVLARRFGHNDWEFPDLILIDGGKGQVSSAKEIAKSWNVDVPIYGLVKDDKHRTRGVTTEKEEINLPVTGRVFKFFERIQDEVHRFAIKTHTNKHSKSMLNSELMKIKGVGKRTQEALLKKFGSVERIREARVEELMEVRGVTLTVAEQLKIINIK